MNVEMNADAIIENREREVPRLRLLEVIPRAVPDRNPDAQPGSTKIEYKLVWKRVGDESKETGTEYVHNLMEKEVPDRRYKDSQGNVQIKRGYTRRAKPEWEALRHQFEAYLANDEIPENGTPLFAWPGMTKAVAEALKAISILTIEDFAEAEASTLRKVRLPGIERVQAAAFDFLLAQGEASRVAEELSKRDEKVNSMEAMMADMQEELNALRKQVAAKTTKGKAKADPPEDEAEASQEQDAA